MKTTIDLPDRLFAEVKAVAARRRTTMKAMMEHALRREIAFAETPQGNAPYELNEHGFPVLKKRIVADARAAVTSEMIYQMMEEEGV